MNERDFSKNKFVGAFALESMISWHARQKIKALLIAGIVLLTAVIVLVPIGLGALASVAPLPELSAALSAIVEFNARFSFAVLVLCIPILLILFAFDGFWNSKTFDKSGEVGEDILRKLDFYASELWWEGPRYSVQTSTQTLFSAIPRTATGRVLLARLGINLEKYKSFVGQGDGWKTIDECIDALRGKTPGDKSITLPILLQSLFEEHAVAKKFLDSLELSITTLVHAADWLEREFFELDRKRRWWLRENLARIPGIGKEWSYGLTPILQQYAYDVEWEALRMAERELIGKDREIQLLESALLKDTGSNVIIVGEVGSGRHVTLLGLVRMIAWGTIFPELENKRVFKLQGSVLSASAKTKGEIEATFIKILNEAVEAGNIILAIDEFPEFIDSLSKSGVNAVEILSPYLAHPAVHILAIADTLGFRRIIENNAGLMKYFERIEVNEPDEDRLREILEDHVAAVEGARRQRVFLTYPAIETIARGAIENLVAGALPKRAVDLLEEAAEEADGRHVNVVEPKLVLDLITRKTKIPLGEIGKDEQEKLLHLEDFLRKRVIGQDEATAAVADAIRRARSGIKNPKRPIGSFLFLGPTGVGKTETAKALAANYFGSEEAMLRYDMTEYQTEEGFEKLVGSFEKNEPGLLTSRMRAAPYALVLLDEFEKSNQKVKNLFLQVLDEGFFTDYLGRKVNMRNTIIIATSNAGAKLIWEFVEKGTDPATLRQELFSSIQKEGLYSPELLNRFDAIIIFHPLGKSVLTDIARVHHGKFVDRLKASKNMTLDITEPLVEAVAKGGYDPLFGARPMQRFLQDKVEKLVADKIIKGEIKSGSSFSFLPEEVAAIA